jgi:hypothetical protein
MKMITAIRLGDLIIFILIATCLQLAFNLTVFQSFAVNGAILYIGVSRSIDKFIQEIKIINPDAKVFE